MNNIFLDANIIIDFLDKNRINHLSSIKLIIKLVEEKWQIFISEDILTTIYYIVKDKKRVLNFFQDILEDWNIVNFGKNIIEESIKYSLKNNKDLEDTFQCMVAKKYNCIVITNDKKFVNCGIKIYNYEEFFKKFNKE